MASRKVLVIGAGGHLEELQPGDVAVGPFEEVDVTVLTNDNAGVISKGQTVYITGASACDLAQANASGTAGAFGMVFDSTIAAAAAGNVQMNGIIEIPDWTGISDAAALVPGSVYFLSAGTAGGITVTVPTGAPNSRVKMGRAESTTRFKIEIDAPILRS